VRGSSAPPGRRTSARARAQTIDEKEMFMTLLPHPRTRLALGAAVGLALVVGTPLAASAHVHVTPDASAAEATTTLTFSFSHGCEDSPTTAMIIEIPQGVTNVVPVASALWTIDRTLADNGTVTRVTYTATQPIVKGVKGEVAMDARFAAELADSQVAFPVTQKCVTGQNDWTQVAAEGASEPESPAPLVSVGDVAPDAGAEDHDHDAAGMGDEHVTAASPASVSDAVGVWLGGAGLAFGAAALVLAIFALRRRRA
jgi:periplasmic copper chaperone A